MQLKNLFPRAAVLLSSVMILFAVATPTFPTADAASLAESREASNSQRAPSSPSTGSTLFLPFIQRACSGSLLSPANGATLAQALFDWSDVPGATSYQFQISGSPSFTSLAVNQTVTASQYLYRSNLTGLYYWRVMALGSTCANRTVNLIDYAADADGDSLWNGWEIHGYDANADGVVEVALPGANYLHKDIYVEMDYMYRASATNTLAPSQAVIDSIVASFNAAPLTNPDGVTGIHIHPEMGNLVPYDNDLNPPSTDFYPIKNSHFNPQRAPIYHYMVWADRYYGGNSSGYSFGIPASDFIVTLGGWNSGAGGTDNQKIGTFIHELGHNLGLYHGGGTDGYTNYKPNYLSIMNYWFQTWGVYRNGSYGNFDYQRISLPALNELSLNELVGLNGGAPANPYGTVFRCPDGAYYLWAANDPIDWNCNGSAQTGVTADINWDGSSAHSYTTLAATPSDWPLVVFHGGGTIGSGLSPEELLRSVRSRAADNLYQELTWEQQQQIEQHMPAKKQ